MTEKMREEFEAKLIATKGSNHMLCDLVRNHDGEYRSACERAAWWAWQASRESLVIDLPKPYAVVGDYAACGGDRAVWDVEYAEKITDRMCEKTAVYDRACLEAAGLKVKTAA